jgi:4-amino-4-deoxychorismate lyase
LSAASVFFETICVLDGRVLHLAFHQQRVDRTRKEVFSGDVPPVLLEECISVPASCREGKYKCRVTYGKEISSVVFEKYQTPLIRTVQLVEDNTIDYTYKSCDRDAIERLFARRAAADDILIVKHGCIADTSYANVCLFHEERGWCTPDTPLLEGTMRSRLIQERYLTVTHVTVDMLHQFQKLSLLNAMLHPGEIEIPIINIQPAL